MTTRAGGRWRIAGQRGTTLAEVLVASFLMTLVIASMSSLIGAAFKGKMITAVRSADTETARQTLEWMSERMRNAGLNVRPSAQPQVRCQDMVVAQDAALRPTPDSVYVSGEILNNDTTAGNEVITLGYRLQGTAVVEDRSTCAGGWAPIQSTVSNTRIPVTVLSFRYFTRTGDEIVVPTTDVEEIRSIRFIEITLTVQAQEGTSGLQTQTFRRMVMLRNPRPDTNDWLVSVETNP